VVETDNSEAICVKGDIEMHTMLLVQTQAEVFSVEHEDRLRQASRQRLLAEARAAEKQNRVKPKQRRGFIPRVAGALGLF
jgi:competence protein ComGC